VKHFPDSLHIYISKLKFRAQNKAIHCPRCHEYEHFSPQWEAGIVVLPVRGYFDRLYGMSPSVVSALLFVVFVFCGVLAADPARKSLYLKRVLCEEGVMDRRSMVWMFKKCLA